MPVCNIHLLSLNVPISAFQTALRTTQVTPLVISKVIRWIIRPTTLSTSVLLNEQWDLLLILASQSPLPKSLRKLVRKQWSVSAGIPSRLIGGFRERNQELLHMSKDRVPPLTGALQKPRIANSAQNLELTEELREWMENFSQQEGASPVSMLNLLSFKPNMKESYIQYGKAFAESIGVKRGGNAKIVGTVVEVNGRKRTSNQDQSLDDETLWDEVALAHYPSIWHFADMAASDDYQEVNHRFRVPALRDTLILCTIEIALEQDAKARL
ncbi:hypothetical protein M501DRAFT_1003545 [Patellaria atrata CBS 101060]|uniref:Uncharacterized protein n=1 Tax=Patellaria atrata CBS 101060 TaxID=1346257 RepID=A0A9P4VSX5_9PEZI|nr:hypothetical protein M501DRAFT_1003545 [Patellaria atrata CBS 101060]